MTREEVRRVLASMKETRLLMAKLLYGGGLQLTECVRFRGQDLDIDPGLLYVRAAKGDKHRLVDDPLAEDWGKTTLSFDFARL